MKSIAFALTLTTATLLSSSAQAAPAAAVPAIMAPTPIENLYAAVPEPSRGLMMLAGLAGLVVRRRRR